MADPKPPIPTLDEPIVPGALEPETAGRLSPALPPEPEASAAAKDPVPPPAGPGDLEAWIEATVTTVLERYMRAARREIAARVAAEIRSRQGGVPASGRD